MVVLETGVADPRRGGPQIQYLGKHQLFWPFLPENCMTLKKIEPREGLPRNRNELTNETSAS